MRNIDEIRVYLSQELSMKNILLSFIIVLTPSALLAQSVVKKGDVVIHISGSVVAINDHKFDLDIYKKGNSVEIKYTSCDSIKYAEIRKDPEFRRLNDISFNYEPGIVKRNLMSDSIGMVIEKHKAFTRDSVLLKLKTDTSYRNLLQRIANADKAELTPKIESHLLDGYNISIRIITTDKNLFLVASNPELKTHALLFSIIKQTLNKNKNSNAVQKIRKHYTEF